MTARTPRMPAALLLTLMAFAPAPGAPKRFIAEGVVRSENRIEIKSKSPSPIRRIAVEEGHLVQRDDPLVELDNSTERAQIEAATA